MASNEINKLFKITTEKTVDGSTIQGINQENFFAAMASIFTDENIDCGVIFNELDKDNNKILSTEELAALNNYMENGFIEEQQNIIAENDTFRGILESARNFGSKLSSIKSLNLTDTDIKNFSVTDVIDILDLLSGVYASDPSKLTQDLLYISIENTLPDYVIRSSIEDNKSGYWLKKYGSETIEKSLNEKTPGYAQFGFSSVAFQGYEANWSGAEQAVKNLKDKQSQNINSNSASSNFNTGISTSEISGLQGLSGGWKANWSGAEQAVTELKTNNENRKISAVSTTENIPPVDTTSASVKSGGKTQTGTNGKKLADAAYKTGTTRNTVGWCGAGVNDALQSTYGFRCNCDSAYQMADILASKGMFKEVTSEYPNREDLKNLPPGAIVVWDKYQGNPHGHVSIALGDGREASDNVRAQYQNIPSSYRIFIPNEGAVA